MEKDNLNRIWILQSILSKPKTISELSKELGVSRPTIYLHLEVLEKKGYIKKIKNSKKKGAPVTVHTTPKKVKSFNKQRIIEYLKIVEKNEGKSHIEIIKELKKQGIEYIGIGSTISLQGYTIKKEFLTEKGKNFLKGNT